MARRNRQRTVLTSSLAGHTYEGAEASILTPEQELTRSVLANLLWENTFYEQGEENAARIQRLVGTVDTGIVSDLAVRARNEWKLRHVPLWLLCSLAYKTVGDKRQLTAEALAAVIERPDEITEFLAMYWKDGKHPLASQIKLGLAQAFRKFDGFQLTRYRAEDKAIALRDAMFLSHPKP